MLRILCYVLVSHYHALLFLEMIQAFEIKKENHRRIYVRILELLNWLTYIQFWGQFSELYELL